MSPDEDRLRDLLSAAAQNAVPAAGTVAAARRRGLRLRRRRSVATALAAGAALAVGFGVFHPHSSAVPADRPQWSPTPRPEEDDPVGRVEVLWQGEWRGEAVTNAIWFSRAGLSCVGDPEGPYSCSGGSPVRSAPGIQCFDGGGEGWVYLDGGAHTWYLLTVGRETGKVTVTLTDGTVLTAAMHLADGPQPQVLAVAIAPPGSVARTFTAYDAAGKAVQTVEP